MITKPNNSLGSFERLVLTAVVALEDDAYGLPVSAKVDEMLDSRANQGSVYVTLERLEEKGYLTSKFVDGPHQRGGRQRRVFRITALGKTSLLENVEVEKRIHQTLAKFMRLEKWKPSLPKLGLARRH